MSSPAKSRLLASLLLLFAGPTGCSQSSRRPPSLETNCGSACAALGVGPSVTSCSEDCVRTWQGAAESCPLPLAEWMRCVARGGGEEDLRRLAPGMLSSSGAVASRRVCAPALARVDACRARCAEAGVVLSGVETQGANEVLLELTGVGCARCEALAGAPAGAPCLVARPCGESCCDCGSGEWRVRACSQGRCLAQRSACAVGCVFRGRTDNHTPRLR